MLFQPWKSCFYALLLHPNAAKLLLISDNNNYFLPHIELKEGIWLSNVQVIKDAIEQELDITVNILHYASYQVNNKKRQIEGIYVLEQYNPTEEIKVGVWCDLATVNTLSFSCLEQKAIIEQYLIELENGSIPKIRPPWARYGWFSEAYTWIKQQLEELGYQQLAPIEYEKNWSISCILKVKTSAGTIYFKQASTLPLFCHEPPVTAELAKLFPHHIPTVLSFNCQRHWLLLADFGEPIGNVSLEMQGDIYRLFAQIQIESVQYCDRLLVAGCLDRRLDRLQSQIEPLLNNQDALLELSTTEINEASID